MSQENVEIVTRHFGALIRELDRYWENPRSFAAAAANGELDPDQHEVYDRLHPEVRWTQLGGEIYEGRIAVARGVDDLLQASREYAVRVDEVTDLGGDQVLVVVRSEMRGKSSGAPATVLLFTVVVLREGLLLRFDEYLSREPALKAVGLEAQAVSQNLNLVRSIYANWERGDWSHVEWADPEIEYVLADGPEPGSRKGVAAMAETWSNRLSAFDDFRVTVSECRELDEERILVFARQYGRGKSSGLDIDDMGGQAAALVHVYNARVTRLVVYRDSDRALADLGLKEQPVSHENVEIVRGGLRHFQTTGELPWHVMTQDFVWDMSRFRGWPEQPVYEGTDGAGRFIEDWGGTWEDWTVEAESFHDAGDTVVMVVRQRGRSKATGISVHMVMAMVYTLRDGKQVRMVMYADPSEALKAVGLEDQARTLAYELARA